MQTSDTKQNACASFPNKRYVLLASGADCNPYSTYTFAAQYLHYSSCNRYCVTRGLFKGGTVFQLITVEQHVYSYDSLKL